VSKPCPRLAPLARPNGEHHVVIEGLGELKDAVDLCCCRHEFEPLWPLLDRICAHVAEDPVGIHATDSQERRRHLGSERAQSRPREVVFREIFLSDELDAPVLRPEATREDPSNDDTVEMVSD